VKRILYETDWLASEPVFYNEKTGKASHNINDVIDYTNLEFHPEGLNNYLDFGYSVLEQTPVRHVKFLRHSSRLWADEQGTLSVEYLDDPVEKWIDYRLSETDVIDLIKSKVQKWEHSVQGQILVPTSGGYDSRLLNWCINDKSRIRSFTYGGSAQQSLSFDVVYAETLSKLLNFQWEHISLGDFNNYIDEWDRLFGPSTHAHGMYQMEFFHKIQKTLQGGIPLLSGVVGDAWAGSINKKAIKSYHVLNILGYTHGMNADVKYSRLETDYSIRSVFLHQNKHKLEDDRYYVVSVIRLKLILLSYLFRVPRYFDFKPWSPFLDIEICMVMLNLPLERRRNRIWQKEFFQKQNISIESMNLTANFDNGLNCLSVKRKPLEPLNIEILREVVEPEYVRWINYNVNNLEINHYDRFLKKLLLTPKLGGLIRMLGGHEGEDKQQIAYCAYLTLLPIAKMIKRRNGQ